MTRETAPSGKGRAYWWQFRRRAFEDGARWMRSVAVIEAHNLAYRNRNSGLLGPEQNCVACANAIRKLPLTRKP